MAHLSAVELAWRLLVAGFVIVAPTLMFLGMIRLLERIRDDALIEQVLSEEERRDIHDSQSLTTLVDELTGDVDVGGSADTVECPSCGTANLAAATFCHECLSRLGRG